MQDEQVAKEAAAIEQGDKGGGLVSSQQNLAREAQMLEAFEAQKAKEVETKQEPVAEEAEEVAEPKQETKGEGLEKKAEEEKVANEKAAKSEPKKEEPKAEVERGEERAWYEDEEQEEGTQASPESKSNVDVDALKAEYESKIQQYESLLEDDFIQSYLNTKSAGKDLTEFFDSIKPQDVKSMTDEQLIRYECEQAGITDEEAIEQELDTLSSLTLLQKKKRLDAIRNEIEYVNAEKVKRYNADTAKVATDKKAIFHRAIQDLETSTNDLVDKTIYGLKITKEIAADIKDLYLNRQMPVFDSNGVPDVSASIELAIYRNYMKTLVKANVNAAKTEGKKEVLKKITNPSANNTASSRVVESRSEIDDIASAMEEFENRGYKGK